MGAVALCAAGLSLAAQTPAPPPKPNEPPPHKQGTVIFSRSVDENGNVTTTTGPAAKPAQDAGAPGATDAERQAVVFTDFDMDVHLRPADHQIAVRARCMVRNAGSVPLAHLPLQISSSLNWDRIRVLDRDVASPTALLNSDADHTGQLREAVVPLPTPLPPGGTLQLDVTYSGAIPSNAQRLLAIGTPAEAALPSDWDQIDTAFTGLRGFGNVVWYPVSSVPVLLTDGAKLFDEIGTHKLHMAQAHLRMRLTVEFPPGQAPTVAVIDGEPAALKVTEPQSDGVDGVATAETETALVGFQAPSLFVAIRKPHPAQNLTAWTTPDNDVNVQFWLDAAAKVTPFLQGWLGPHPRAQLTLLDLPDPHDAPFETGDLLAAGLRDASVDQLTGAMVHALAQAWLQSPRPWLNEGVAHFMDTLWIEKQQGREKALTALEAERGALALAEPASPGDGPGQPLAEATSPVYYRTKAAYVLWMLRDMVGEATLSTALRAYDPAMDVGEQTAPSQLEQLLERSGDRRDLQWFFADWVDADKGLPDLAVDSVYPSAAEAGNWLVAVNVSNAGYAAAEVPVTVRTGDTAITQRMRVPARGKAVQRILIQGRPTEVQVNDGTVPEVQSSVHVTNISQTPSSSSLP